MDTRTTLHNLLDETRLGDDPGFLEAASDASSAAENHAFEWGRIKIHANSVLLQRMSICGSVFPLAYFRLLDSDAPQEIAEAHRLAWNLGRAPLLFAVSPGKVRVYSAYEPPRARTRTSLRDAKAGLALDDTAGLIGTISFLATAEAERQTIARFRREELLSGRFWEVNRARFNPRNHVVRKLLDNLKGIRRRLLDAVGSLPGSKAKSASVIHSLLGRAIFIQYLYDRKDEKGYRAFPSGFFSEYVAGADTFPDVLADKRATYRLFEFLETKFNGDVFPVEAVEKDLIQPDHLRMLADFLRGNMTLSNGQLSFWPYYSFDAIPIEFISNMYEEFFHYEKDECYSSRKQTLRETRKGTYYTPHRMVEFMLDQVLPWEGKESNVRVLDPACGSGVFLVECYRRLISRWQQANPGRKPDATVLRNLLTDNVHGVDLNPEAVRVAAFSLCLTLCDYLDPRYVWASVTFPALRGQNLHDRDFLDFVELSRSTEESFDLVVGNPPWESRLSKSAEAYSAKSFWPVGDKQVAQVFLAAAPDVCKDTGQICLIAPSKGLLFNASRRNRSFRRKFFRSFAVDVVVNFSALRRGLFVEAIGPAAPVIYRPIEPEEGHKIVYCCPKPCNSPEDGWHYAIEEHDVARLDWRDVVEDDAIWKTAMWAGPRDWELVRKLRSLPTLEKVTKRNSWKHGEGFIVGTSDRKPAAWLTGKPYVSPEALRLFTLPEARLPRLTETRFYRSGARNKQIFLGPHVLIGQSPKAGQGFAAALLKGDAVFNHSILGIAGHEQDVETLGALCAVFGADVCTYFAMMTSSRWLVERDELDKGEIMHVALPKGVEEGSLKVPYAQLQAATRTRKARMRLSERIVKAYDLTRGDLALVRDAVTYTLDFFRRGARSDAVKPVTDPILHRYGRTVIQGMGRVFRKTFSGRFHVGTNPMVVLQISLSPERAHARVEVCSPSDQLASVLDKADLILREKLGTGIYTTRDVHVYTKEGILIAKRNQRRLWTESAAMRDTDEIQGAIMRAWGKRAWR